VTARGQDSVKHYTITANDSGYVFGLAKFANMTQFVEHFESQPLLGGESGNSWDILVRIFYLCYFTCFFLISGLF